MRSTYTSFVVAAIFGIGVCVYILIVLPKTVAFDLPLPLQTLPKAHDRVEPLIAEPEEHHATLSFVGDVMLARSVEQAIIKNGPNWPFEKLDDLFVDSDLVIGNFEGTVRDHRNIEVTNQMVFDTTPDNVEMLNSAGFTHLSLANNHTDDYGAQTTLKTRQTLIDNGLVPFGDPLNSTPFIARENVNGVSLSIIGFHAFGEKTEPIVETIKAEHAQGRFVIVYPHWGVEYATTAPSVEINAAKLFVNAGADLIIGAHPHVIQNIELVNGVPVVYSLGNFLFDQDFSTETKRGLTVQVVITDKNVDLKLKPVNIKNRQTIPMDSIESQVVFDGLGIPTGELSVPRQ